MIQRDLGEVLAYKHQIGMGNDLINLARGNAMGIQEIRGQIKPATGRIFGDVAQNIREL